MNSSPSPLSPEFERGLARLREFLAPYPLLAAGITNFRLDDGKVIARWPAYPVVPYAERQAAALEAKDAGKWRRERGHGAYDYHLSGEGIEIEISMSEPLAVEKESKEIQWDALAVKPDLRGVHGRGHQLTDTGTP